MKPGERLDANSGRRTDPVHPTEGRGRHGKGAVELEFLLCVVGLRDRTPRGMEGRAGSVQE